MIAMYKIYRVAAARYCAKFNVRSVDVPTLKAWYAKLNERDRADIIVAAM